MNKFVLHIIVLFFIISIHCEAQHDTFYQEQNGLITDENHALIEDMVTIFEKQLCNYYSIDENESNLAFYRYIQDLKNESVDVKKIASEEIDTLLKKSSNKLIGYVWITNKDKRSRWRKKHYGTNDIVIQSSNSRVVEQFKKQLKATENILSLDYESEFTDGLARKTYIEDLKDMIFTLKDKPGSSDSSHLIASGLSGIKKEDFNDTNLKTYIAFELFYATLNTLQNE